MLLFHFSCLFFLINRNSNLLLSDHLSLFQLCLLTGMVMVRSGWFLPWRPRNIPGLLGSNRIDTSPAPTSSMARHIRGTLCWLPWSRGLDRLGWTSERSWKFFQTYEWMNFQILNKNIEFFFLNHKNYHDDSSAVCSGLSGMLLPVDWADRGSSRASCCVANALTRQSWAACSGTSRLENSNCVI